MALQMQLAPMATCFQFVPSLMARHGTLPVPPALRWMMRTGILGRRHAGGRQRRRRW